MKKQLLALALLSASCGGALAGGTVNVSDKPPVAASPSYQFGIVACAVVVPITAPCPWPLVGAKIEVQHLDGWVSTIANDDGYALMSASIPYSAVRISADGFETLSASIEPPTIDGQNLTFSPPRTVPPQAPLDKRDFIEHYQGNFGSIPVDACWTFGGTLFDPVDLLVAWQTDRGCFEALMHQHLDRGDNRVVIDPRADYHGQGGFADLWHDPARFRQYVLDVRAHRNHRGEPMKVLLFFAADGHIPSFLIGGHEGYPDGAAEQHFERDVHAIAEATRDLIDGTATCWECRHQRDYITPGGYERIGRIVAREFPQAWHGQHLISGSSSWSSWNCDPASADAATQTPPCTEANAHMELDDPYRGNELAPWVKCVAEGWCDGILYQFHVGDEYLNPDTHPNYTPAPGALGRFFEIVVRMGRDPWSIASKRGSDPRWPLNGGVDVLAFEFIYDAYNGRSTEAYGIAFCQRALAFGGWGCGSASWRR